MAETNAEAPSGADRIKDTGERDSVPEEQAQPQDGDSGGDDLATQEDIAQAVEQMIAEEGETADEDEEERSPNAEAAKWRRKLREAEAERDQLAEQVQALQRQQVEYLAAGKLHDTADLWSKHSLDDLLGEDGTVDPAAVDTAIGELPAHFRKAPELLYTQGYQGKWDPPSDTNWGDVLRRR